MGAVRRPVIDAVTCQDITVGHMQQIVNAAPTPGEGGRVQGMISALVGAGLEGGYLANPRLARVHWQAGDRPLPRPGSASLATQRCGSTLPRFSPTRTSPSSAERCTGRHGERDELMAVTAAYSGLRWGELTALTTGQIDQVGSGHHGGPQGGRDRRAPVRRGAEEPENAENHLPLGNPGGYPLAARLADRIEQARAEQRAGTNPLG
jgi:hypothetical protein